MARATILVFALNFIKYPSFQSLYKQTLIYYMSQKAERQNTKRWLCKEYYITLYIFLQYLFFTD